MKESKLTSDISRILRAQGAIVYPVVASQYAPSGFPDRVVWSKQWRGWIEFKALHTTVKPMQWEVVRQLNRLSAWSAVLCREHCGTGDGRVVEVWTTPDAPEDTVPVVGLLRWLGAQVNAAHGPKC